MAKSKSEDPINNLNSFFKRGASTRTSGNIPTGHFNLDFVIHYGELPSKVDLNSLEDYDPSTPLGIPRGRIVEIFGEEGSGKSSLAYRVCGCAQKMGLDAIWIDAENSFSDNLAHINGVDTDKLIFSDLCDEENVDNIYFAEDVMDNIITACKLNSRSDANVGAIVVDSVASLVPKSKGESGADDVQPGVLARMLSDNLKKVANYANKYGVSVIFINQIREKVGVMFGDPTSTPGGKALKHQSSLRIRINKKGGKDSDIMTKDEDGKERLLGRIANFKIEKNRFAKPFRDAIPLPVYYEPYFPDVDDMLFDTGRQMRLISCYKQTYKWNGIEADDSSEFISKIRKNEMFDDLMIAIDDKAKEKGVVVPPELSQEIKEAEKRKKKSSNKSDSSSNEQESNSGFQRGGKGKNNSKSSSNSKKSGGGESS